MNTRRVTVLVDLPPASPMRQATVDALQHAIDRDVAPVVVEVCGTDEIGRLGDGVVMGPGTPYRDPASAERAIRHARERGLPLLATWGGFQHVLVEHARSLCGVTDAMHAEYGETGSAVISLLTCSLAGRTIEVDLVPGTQLARIHAALRVVERTTCNYGLNPEFVDLLMSNGLFVAGTDDTGEVRAVERSDHPFLVGTLYMPQLTTSSERPHALWSAFIDAVVQRR